MRYAMAAGQIGAAVLLQLVLGVDLPLAWIALPPAVVALSNLWLDWRFSPSRLHGELTGTSLIGWTFVLDIFCLTAILMLSGGPTNPFSLLYLVYITLAAAILTQRQTWWLGILASACFALLFWKYRPVPQLSMSHHGAGSGCT